MKKKAINTDAITNDLRESSLFIQRPPTLPEVAPEDEAAEPVDATPLPHDTSEPEPPTRTPRPESTARTPRTGSTTPLPVKRSMKRHPFEIYYDQYESLIRLAAEDRMRGGVGSMSQMVREALDRLIAERESNET